ncbi:MAG: hypothetical protein MZU97_05600 [Bacillus subtilis]|nr:hypothetical protein [Bacillus subtilis]
MARAFEQTRFANDDFGFGRLWQRERGHHQLKRFSVEIDELRQAGFKCRKLVESVQKTNLTFASQFEKLLFGNRQMTDHARKRAAQRAAKRGDGSAARRGRLRIDLIEKLQERGFNEFHSCLR